MPEYDVETHLFVTADSPIDAVEALQNFLERSLEDADFEAVMGYEFIYKSVTELGLDPDAA